MRTDPFTLHSATGALAIVVLCAGAAQAQEMLFKAGIASSTLSFEGRDANGTDGRGGVVAGASFFLLAADRGGWQAEVLLVQKGARNVIRAGDEVRLTYVEVPVLFHADIWQRGARGVFFSVGPAVAFNVGGTYVDDGVEENIREDIARVDASLHFGGGVELGALVVEARYVLGLRQAFVADDRSVSNRTLMVTAGIRPGR